VPSKRPELALWHAGDVMSIEGYRAGLERHHPEQGSSRRRLSTPGLTDETDRLTDADIEIDVVHRVNLLPPHARATR
jgi:hypothetical protein